MPGITKYTPQKPGTVKRAARAVVGTALRTAMPVTGHVLAKKLEEAPGSYKKEDLTAPPSTYTKIKRAVGIEKKPEPAVFSAAQNSAIVKDAMRRKK